MEEVDKLPLKRVELSLTKFNDVAIPHHLDLLRQHKANIIKYGEQGAAGRVRAEQAHARRVAGQLRVLLQELDALRRQVRSEDWARFDALTQRTRDLTLRAIVDYLESSPVAIRQVPSSGDADEEGAVSSSALSTESVGVLAYEPTPEPAQLHLQHDEQELQLQEREEVLRGWGELQREVRALHDVWQHVHAAAVRQREQVVVASGSVDVAADNVAAARGNLSIAERLSVGAASVGGALLGAACGGPLGLLVGAKAGACAALAGAALGIVGVRAARRMSLLPAPAAIASASHAHSKEQ